MKKKVFVRIVENLLISRKYENKSNLKKLNYKLSELIECSKKKDSKAQNLLMNTFFHDVKSYVLSILKEDADAEDITSEVFIKVFSKLDLYNYNFGFKNWVISMAHNCSIDFLRKKKFFYSLESDFLNKIVDNVPSVEEHFIEKQQDDRFEILIKNLDEKNRIIIELRYMKNFTIREIAKQLGISLSNTKVRLMRARKLLAK